jgi:hypothetical protein
MPSKNKPTTIIEKIREQVRGLLGALGPLLSPGKLEPKLVPVRRNPPARRRKP